MQMILRARICQPGQRPNVELFGSWIAMLGDLRIDCTSGTETVIRRDGVELPGVTPGAVVPW